MLYKVEMYKTDPLSLEQEHAKYLQLIAESNNQVIIKDTITHAWVETTVPVAGIPVIKMRLTSQAMNIGDLS